MATRAGINLTVSRLAIVKSSQTKQQQQQQQQQQLLQINNNSSLARVPDEPKLPCIYINRLSRCQPTVVSDVIRPLPLNAAPGTSHNAIL